MTEINIILDTDFNVDSSSTFNINDKEIFYEDLSRDLNLYQYNSYSNYKIEYNQIVENFLFNDNYLDYEKELENINIDIKKLLLKKLLIFFNPIVNIKNLSQLREKNQLFDSPKKKNIIVDRNNILLNYAIYIVYLINKIKYSKYKLSHNTNILLNGLINSKYYNNNLPYSLNNFKYINLTIIHILSKFFKQNIFIYLKNLNYENKGFVNIDKIENKDLKDLYKLYLEASYLYFNNAFINSNISNLLIKEYSIYKDIINFNKFETKLVDDKFNKNYITEFNKFLNYKIHNQFNNHSYFAFESNNLLELYEKILIYSIDNKNIKNQIESIKKKELDLKTYKENQKVINEYNLKRIQLELLTKQKFPNLFNPNSKEVLFTKYKSFNFDDLPKKYKEIILIEYKKLENYKQEYAKNKCKHKDLIHKLSYLNNKYTIVQELNKLIKNINNKDNYYKCIICSYNLICPHILEYYNLLFNKKKNNTDEEVNEFSIRQRIINKYMADAKINMIYYCRICGEELGKSLELEKNIEYKDKVKLNTAEYTDDTLELIKSNLNHIIYTYITFTELNLNVTKKYLINYILDNIVFYINNVEKTLRKSKLYNDEKINDLLNFNSIIFIYSTLIYIMSKYPFISFLQTRIKTGKKEITKSANNLKDDIIIQKKSKSPIIIPKKVKLESTKDLLNIMKSRFKEAFDLIISTNYILLNKLNYIKNSEQIKELLLKTYGIVAKTDQITINEKEKSIISNENLLLNSNIYNYYYLIKSIYPLSNNKSEYLPSFTFNDRLYNFNNKFIKINNYELILNKKNIDSKVNNIFDNFQSPIINNIDKLTNLNNYNDYKIISFNLFNYHIKNELYNLPIYEIISTIQNKDTKLKKSLVDNIYLDIIKDSKSNKEYEQYIKYIKLTQLVKQYEIELINKNIITNNYPYSLIKLNNLRYYQSKQINLNIYFCKKDGFPHKYNIYLFKLNKKDIEIEKNKLDQFINSLKFDDNLEFIDYKCTKCLESKNKLYNIDKYDNIIIDNLINNINDINGFFNLYLNLCPVTTKNNDYQFHDFDYSKNDNIYCKICKINYYDLLNKNKEIYQKFNKEYNTYKESRLEYFNNKLNSFDINKNKLKNINIKESYNNLLNKNDNKKYIDNINKLILDNLIIELSKKYNINILYLQKLGLTEGYHYDDINNIEINYNNIDNRLNKLNTYMRNLLIYYNILKNNKSVNNYYDSNLNDILNNIKDINIKLSKDLPEYNINLSNILIELKINKTNKEIIEFCLKSIYNFIIELEKINKNKFNNKLNEFIDFIIKKILKYDELFTNYNYSQLKQMFTEDKYDINYTFEENQEYENEDDDELFGYNDLNINFEDEEPIDE